MSETNRRIKRLREKYLKKKQQEQEARAREEQIVARQEKLVENDEYLFKSFAAQDRFINAVFNRKPYQTRFVIGGSIRSGKTYVCIIILIIFAQLFPNSKWVIIRHDTARLKRTTLEVFNQVCPAHLIAKGYNGLSGEVLFKNGSRFIFMSETNYHDRNNKLRGLYINGAFGDEFNELSKATYSMLKTRLGSHKVNCWRIDPKTGAKIYPPPIFLGACNPSQNWVKDMFYTPWELGTLPPESVFHAVNIRENPYITQEDLDQFKDLEEDEFNQYINGSWDAADAPRQLIRYQYINQCRAPLPDEKYPETYLGVDVASVGDDKCVYLLIKGSNIVDPIESEKYTDNTMNIAKRIKELMAEHDIKPENVVVDSVSNGVADRLYEDGIPVQVFKGSYGATCPHSKILKFQDLKAQSYWLLKEKLKNKEIGNLVNPSLRTELAAIEKDINEYTFRVESKGAYKKRTSKSPDFADALVYACWAKHGREMAGSTEMFFLN